MKAQFIVPFENNNAVLPPMTAIEGVQLSYSVDGVGRGGFSIVSINGSTCVVDIDTSAETIAAMEADARFERVS